MTFAFCEEIDGPSWLPWTPGTGGGNGLVFGSRPRAGAQSGGGCTADFAAGKPFRRPAVSPHDPKAQSDRRRADAARPGLDGVEGMEAALGQQSATPVGLVRVGVTVTASRFLSLSLPTLLADHP